MKINNLRINGFGKIENKEINLNNNINIIYGENEAGKTTLLKFISGIFYGVSKNKNKKEISDFEKYKPWKAEEFSGKIEYTLDNNETYEVFREFNKKNPKIYKNSEEISKNFNIDKTKGNEFFYEQTGVDEESFLSTTLIEQKEVVLNNEEQNILTQKIANLLSTGEENVSYKKTIAYLNKKQLEEVGSTRTVGRPINVICDNIEKLEKEQQSSCLNDEQKNELFKRQKNTTKKLEERKNKIELLKKIISIKKEENLEKEKININNEIINEEENKIINLKNKINEKKIKINNKKNKIINFVILFLLFIINILLFIFKINKIFKFVSIILTLLFLGYLIVKKIKINKIIKFKKMETDKLLLEIKTAEKNIENIKDKINLINNKIIEKNKEKYIIIKNEYIEKINTEEIEYFWNEKVNEIELILESFEHEINNLKLQLHTNEIEYNNVINKLEEKAKIEEDLQGLINEKNELLKKDKAINMAKEAMDRAYNKMKEEITPKFTKNLSEIVANISNKKYNKIKFVDGEGLIVELSNGEYINANKLSTGTIDQLYLSLRLSAMQEITKEKMPIILDETFAYYDNKRLENILKYLNDNLKDNQILIFTCSNREKEILQKNQIKYNLIEI